ncbi:2'-5' RNA ligase family protein [Janibacter cremeus]|uniref:2'-5' RNA ligase n=1 Tax=Janibacter cremeus TaxID=1285192 RepID=A0A852VS25_9MICO|nr:2'-5' RNA ligase family protein [Janibacter cremeus]NYF99056.1 2'-5' RNA ligase [Janibacter cremeus]
MAVHGVSIAVPEPWCGQLQRQREDVGDPMAHAIPPHITLMPPTEIAASEMDRFVRHLEGVAGNHGPFTVRLRGTGTFLPVSRVVFVQVSQGIPMCERLEQAVRRGPVSRDLEFPYHPHVTIAHDIDESGLDRAFDDLAGFDASFEVSRFHLYDHGADEVWRPMVDFDLTGERLQHSS